MNGTKSKTWAVLIFCCITATAGGVEEPPSRGGDFETIIKPILQRHCYDCHADGGNEGGVSFDMFSSPQDIIQQKKLWLAVLDNVRAGLMPPPTDTDPDSRPTADEVRLLVDWIKFTAFAIDPANPDPGHVVPRRLNRVEYQNTIRDLLDYKFRADREFPPDDSGGGFDNNGDVLTLSTLLIEKYLVAAESIITEAVPQSSKPDSPDDEKSKRDDQDKKAAYERIFTDGPPPRNITERDKYAARILRAFATRAFRRPVDANDVQHLVRLARSVYSQDGGTFGQGVSRAMMAVLASPKFLFRIEGPIAGAEGDFVLLDEYSLASRLSYFLWSSMPDDELMELAGAGRLRKQLATQVRRMLTDRKIENGLVRNFTGQWLRTRDIDSVEINGKAVLGKGPVNGNRRTKYDFDGKIREAMRDETERYIGFVIEENRSVLEFIDSDYAFLNERLARQYDIPNVKGDKLRRVKLPSDSYRGGVLTQGSVLAVTSNPTRTSPVKRGVFVLENILGTPPPPPPANVADLDAAIEEGGDKTEILSEALTRHRANDVCSSCHNRMDPIGLAFENFIPMGNYRETESGQPIDAAGQLITGERFSDIRELKKILAKDRRTDFFRCLSRKMLTYAIGRGLDYRDTHTVDEIVNELEKDDGRISTLIMSIVESPAFQKQSRQQLKQP